MAGGDIGDLDRVAQTSIDRGADVVATAGTALGAALAWGIRTVARPAGLRGLAVEAGCVAALAALYPWGVLAEQVDPDGHDNRYRTDQLSPRQRGLVVADMQAAGTPILLLHGLAHNRSAFAVLSRALRRRGFGTVHSVNYGVFTVLTSDIRRSAAEFGRHVERLCEETGTDQVHVVGHSLGGMVARYYVQCLGGHARVHTLVTLGSPHAGTMAAYLLPTPLVRQLRPGSDVVTELAGPAPGCTTRFVSVWSELDEVVVPQRNACLEHPDLDIGTLRLRAAGHMSMPMDPRAVHAVATTLANLDSPVSEPLPPFGSSPAAPPARPRGVGSSRGAAAVSGGARRSPAS